MADGQHDNDNDYNVHIAHTLNDRMIRRHIVYQFLRINDRDNNELVLFEQAMSKNSCNILVLHFALSDPISMS